MFTYLPFPIQQAAGRAWDDRPDPADRHRRELARFIRAEARERRTARLARLGAALARLRQPWRRLLPAGL